MNNNINAVCDRSFPSLFIGQMIPVADEGRGGDLDSDHGCSPSVTLGSWVILPVEGPASVEQGRGREARVMGTENQAPHQTRHVFFWAGIIFHIQGSLVEVKLLISHVWGSRRLENVRTQKRLSTQAHPLSASVETAFPSLMHTQVGVDADCPSTALSYFCTRNSGSFLEILNHRGLISCD